MPPDWDIYEYTLRDLGASLSCPQCRAVELLDAVGQREDDTSRGQRLACRVILREPHRCGKEHDKYPREAARKCGYFAPYMGGRLACVRPAGHEGHHKAPGIFGAAAVWFKLDD